MSGLHRSPVLKRPQSGGAPRHAVTLGMHDAEITAMARQGLTREEIARRVDCGHVTVTARLERLGVPLVTLRHAGNALVASGQRDNDILAMLVDGLFRPEIARQLDCNQTVLCHRIQALKAARRG